MLRNKTQLAIMAVLLLALAMIVLLSIRSANRPAQIPTVNVSDVQTKAVETFAFGLTGTTQAEPAQTLTITSLTTATATSVGTQDLSGTPGCFGMHFVMDVSIPDNTVMTPAQVFTKSWLVENSGTCDWQPGFKVILIGGVAMGGSPFIVAQPVKPGGRIQVSIKMAAPTNQNGIVQGTWKMSDANETQFGDYMSVVIVVGNTTGTPPTLEATTTP
jgi:hypothetical protein